MKQVLTVSFTILYFLAFAQIVQIKDYDSNKPISHVYAYSGCYSSTTNDNGLLDLSEFCSDSTIIFQHASYADYAFNPKGLDKDSLYTIYLFNDIFNLDEVVVSASKWDEANREVSRVIRKIKAKDVALYHPQTSADLLSVNSKVFIQKSQLGGGSPMIRGFSANRVLLVMDGVRMNNAIYRSGNLQNILNIDPNALESTEIIFGPGSVIYGSDALGGVMSFSSHATRFSEHKFKVGAKGLLRFSSANQEKTASGTVSLSAKKWASVTSISSSIFSDLRMGSKGHPSYEKQYYVLNDGKKDSVYQNTDPNLQIGSAYNQFNILQKLAFKIRPSWTLRYHFYYSELSNVPRYDRSIQLKKGKPKYAEWYYGPQKWMMHTLSLTSTQKTFWYDRFRTLLSYQKYQESRHKRKLDSLWKGNRKETVNMMAVNLDFLKKMSERNTLYYGVETWYNRVGSISFKNNIYTAEEKADVTRYPNGSGYFSSAVYLTDKHQISEKLSANAGLRFSFVGVEAQFDTSFFKFPQTDVEIYNSAFSGSLGLIYFPNHNTKVSINYASGFRSPNIDDLSKVFECEQKTVVVPNPDLRPEHAHSIDLTLEKEISKRVRILLNGYYTYLDNAMITSDFPFNGQDSVVYDGSMRKTIAVTNKNYAQIYGMQAVLDWRFYTNFYLKSSLNYSKGYDSEGYGVRHVPPLFGGAHLIYNNTKWIADVNVKYNGKIRYKDLALKETSKKHMYELDDEGNPYSPAWYTLNFNFSYQVMPNFTLAFAVENILDCRYRPYSSGIAAPGRNVILSIRLHSF